MTLRNFVNLAVNWVEGNRLNGSWGLTIFRTKCSSEIFGLPYSWFVLHNVPLVSFFWVYILFPELLCCFYVRIFILIVFLSEMYVS